MPSSTILSDNGVSSGSAGLKSTAGNDGSLLIQTSTAAGAATTAITISNTQVATFANQPILSGGTANGVAYLNSSKILTTGTGLVFDATNTRLGIGVSSPSTILHLSSSAQPVLTIATTSASSGAAINLIGATASYKNWSIGATAVATNGALEFTPSTTNGGSTFTTPAMTLDASGALNIAGATNEQTLNFIDTSNNLKARLVYRNSSTGNFEVTNTTSAALVFGTNNTERARIDSSGNLLVGTQSNSPSTTAGVYIYGASTTAGYLLNNSTSTAGISLALFYSSYSTANQTKFEVTSEGNVKSRTNSYAGFSDERLKQNITPASSQWNDIKSYDVVKFQMKSEQFSDDENPWMIGVIAQQVEQVSPGLVDEDIKDGMKTVKYSILYMKAVKALQEAMTRIEQLETKVAALEAK